MEVIASQKAMLARQNRRGAELDEQKLRETYIAQLKRVYSLLARRPEVQVFTVKYADLIADPLRQVNALAEFFGQPFNRQAAINAVRPQLQRQKAQHR